MEETILAYAAGLLDGEGHVGILATKATPPYRSGRHRLVVGICMTEESVIRWLAETFGANVYTKKPRLGRRTVAFVADWQSLRAADFLRKVQPWLRVKSGHAALAIEFQESCTAWDQSHAPQQRFRKLPEEEIERRHSYYLRLRSFNMSKGRSHHFPCPVKIGSALP